MKILNYIINQFVFRGLAFSVLQAREKETVIPLCLNCGAHYLAIMLPRFQLC